jgi:molecular chaperone DnaK
VDLRRDPQALQRLRDAAEKAKIELSTSKEAEVNLPFITVKDGQPSHLVMKLNRAKLESLIGELVDKTFQPVKACLKDAKIDIKKINEVVLVGGMTRMPIVITKVKEFFGREPNRSVNPDEVVALGAAIQGGVLTGETKDILLLDVTPLTLGVETLGGVMTPLIQKNTTIPNSKAETFSTAGDNQTQVEIHVVQGERPMARDNKSLGRFTLDGIPPAPRGVPQIEVSFDLDNNGILTVTAKDKATGKSQAIKITGSTGLTKDEIEKMREEAEKNADKDRDEKEKIEVRNKADNMIYVSEKSLRDAGDKVDKTVKENVEKKIKELKEKIEKGTKDEIESKTKDLSEELSKIGQAMYGKGQPGPQAGPQNGQPKEEDKKDEKGKKVEEGEVVN